MMDIGKIRGIERNPVVTSATRLASPIRTCVCHMRTRPSQKRAVRRERFAASACLARRSFRPCAVRTLILTGTAPLFAGVARFLVDVTQPLSQGRQTVPPDDGRVPAKAKLRKLRHCQFSLDDLKNKDFSLCGSHQELFAKNQESRIPRRIQHIHLRRRIRTIDATRDRHRPSCSVGAGAPLWAIGNIHIKAIAI